MKIKITSALIALALFVSVAVMAFSFAIQLHTYKELYKDQLEMTEEIRNQNDYLRDRNDELFDQVNDLKYELSTK